MISESEMKKLKASAKLVSSGQNSELKKAGDHLVRQAREENKKRSMWAKKDIEQFSKDTASYLVKKATDSITSTVVDTPAGKRAYERAFGKNRKVCPGQWVMENGRMKKIR